MQFCAHNYTSPPTISMNFPCEYWIVVCSNSLCSNKVTVDQKVNYICPPIHQDTAARKNAQPRTKCDQQMKNCLDAELRSLDQWNGVILRTSKHIAEDLERYRPGAYAQKREEMAVQIGAVLRWGRGTLAPQIHLLPPPDSKASWSIIVLTWFLRSQNAPKSKFSEAPPRTPLGSLQCSPRPPNW